MRTVAIFTLAYLSLASIYAFYVGNWEFIIYIAVVFVVGLLVVAARNRLKLSNPVLWALSLWGLLHMLGGLVPIPMGWPVNGENYVLYSLWLIPNYLKYDHLVHAYGFGVATWACWDGLGTLLGSHSRSAGALILSALAGMGLGALNEIVEFMATILVPETNVGGYLNTGWDLVANTVGAVVAVVLIKWKA